MLEKTCFNCLHYKTVREIEAKTFRLICFGKPSNPEDYECEVSSDVNEKKLPNIRAIVEAAMSGIPGKKEKEMAAYCPLYQEKQ